MTTTARHHQSDLLFALAGIGALVLVSLPVGPAKSSGLERALFHAINGAPNFLYWPAWVVMQLGNLLVLAGRCRGDGRVRRWRLAIALLVATGVKLVDRVF